MLAKTVQDAINNQINMEFVSSYIYLSMSAHFEHENLPGFAQWMFAQGEEERLHAMKLFNFINDRGGRVTLQAIPQPPVEFGSPLEVFQKALEHEQKVSASINNLYGLAAKESDYAAQVMLQWFVNEQVEEEKTATQIVEQLKRIGNDGPALLLLDREMGARQAGGGGGGTEGGAE
ncbi:MAG: ferritin [Chloroflexota bacterium]|nr:ferritin [Anaerolineales bacterium]